jgi:hypothetical protein
VPGEYDTMLPVSLQPAIIAAMTISINAMAAPILLLCVFISNFPFDS